MAVPELSIIMPTYKEEENLPLIVGLIEKHLNAANLSHEIIIVDDASPDKTQERARALIRKYGENVVILAPRQGKLGLGTAYVHGCQKARGKYIVLLDADLSHHPKYIPRMYNLLKKNDLDIVTGTRYRSTGTDTPAGKKEDAGVFGWDRSRKFVSSGANVLAKNLLHPLVSDLTGSFRIYKKEVFEDLVASGTPSGYAFQMGIMVKAGDFGYRVGEVPITFVDRIHGQSKLGPNEIITYGKALVHHFFYDPSKLPRRDAAAAKKPVAQTRPRVVNLAAILAVGILLWVLGLIFVAPNVSGFFKTAVYLAPLLSLISYGFWLLFQLFQAVLSFPDCPKRSLEELVEEVEPFKMRE